MLSIPWSSPGSADPRTVDEWRAAAILPATPDRPGENHGHATYAFRGNAYRSLIELEPWTATRQEPILEPGLPIIDPHHHVWDNERGRYLVHELAADVNTGHNTVRAKTRRTAGRSLDMVINSLNPTLRGWFGYFQHSRAATFRILDGWIRLRLRSLLRKQQKRRGVADVRGADQIRWPNRFFAEHGLYSLQEADASVRQSSCR